MKPTIAKIRQEFEKYIVIKDPWVLHVVIGTLVGNFVIKRDPIWTMLVAPASGGKTTLLNPCEKVPNVHFVDDLTEKTFLSAFKPAKGKPPVSFLQQIGSGMMICSDFTTVMSKNKDTRGEILGQMRCVYDGRFIKQTGLGKETWSGKVGFLGAATPEIYHLLEAGKAMGERFMYYWVEQPTKEEISAKQTEVNMSSKDIADAMGDHYFAYCKAVHEYAQMLVDIPPLTMTPAQTERMHRAVAFCVNGKATVHTDFKSGKVDQIPNIAGVGRDNKMFEAMLHALQLMHCYEENDSKLPVQDWMIDLVEKVAYSSVNRERRMILEILSDEESALSASQIAQVMGIEKTGVEICLAPLHAVRLVQKYVKGTNHRWTIGDVDTRAFVRSMSQGMRYTPPPNTDVVIPTEADLHNDEDNGDW